MLRLKILYIVLILPLFCLAQQNDPKLEDLIVSAINGTYPMSYLFKDSVIFEDSYGKSSTYHWKETVKELFPHFIKQYRYTDFSITEDKTRKNVFLLQNCALKHELTRVGSAIIKIKELQTGNIHKCINKPQLTNIENSTDSLEKTIATLIKAFAEKDAKTINKYVHKDRKLIVLYKIGIPGTFLLIDEIDFGDSNPAFWFLDNYSANYMLSYEDVPVYDCDADNWTKSAGLYCSLNHDLLLSETIQFLMEDELMEISKEEYQYYTDLDKSSYKVILTTEGGESGLAFYLTRIDGQWYMTIFDGLSMDCSA